jgi:glycosyltransferase involved in cell wall biosynthesis
MGETWKPSCLLFRSPYVLKNNKIFCSNKHWIPMGIDTDTIQNSKLKKDFCLFVSANTELPKIDSVLSIFSKLPFPEMKLTVFCDTSLDKMVAINNLIQKKSGKVHVEKFDFSKWEKEHHFQFMFAFSDIIQENVKLLFASMLNGAIIIAENHPDLDEIVGETMVNLQINDADVFIEEIKNLIENDEQRSVLQSEYRKKIIETYSYKQIFPKIEEIFIQEKEKQRIQ